MVKEFMLLIQGRIFKKILCSISKNFRSKSYFSQDFLQTSTTDPYEYYIIYIIEVSFLIKRHKCFRACILYPYRVEDYVTRTYGIE